MAQNHKVCRPLVAPSGEWQHMSRHFFAEMSRQIVVAPILHVFLSKSPDIIQYPQKNMIDGRHPIHLGGLLGTLVDNQSGINDYQHPPATLRSTLPVDLQSTVAAMDWIVKLPPTEIWFPIASDRLIDKHSSRMTYDHQPILVNWNPSPLSRLSLWGMGLSHLEKRLAHWSMGDLQRGMQLEWFLSISNVFLH